MIIERQDVLPVHVGVGIVRNKKNQVLIAKRKHTVDFGGLWEFPGGKVEPNESPSAAIVRELEEELSIRSFGLRPLIQIDHFYTPSKRVLLDVWEVGQFSGTPIGAEGQVIQWVDPEQLNAFQFPAANHPIVNACQLPEYYVISPEIESSHDEFIKGLSRTLEAGYRLMQLRCKSISFRFLVKLAKHVKEACDDHGCQLMINSTPEILEYVDADGIHFSQMAFQQWNKNFKQQFHHKRMAVSCHNALELIRAFQAGADFATLSPVEKTASHPEANALGWKNFAKTLKQSNLPVYALGGLYREDLETARRFGAQGVAGISAFWDKPVK